MEHDAGHWLGELMHWLPKQEIAITYLLRCVLSCSTLCMIHRSWWVEAKCTPSHQKSTYLLHWTCTWISSTCSCTSFKLSQQQEGIKEPATMWAQLGSASTGSTSKFLNLFYYIFSNFCFDGLVLGHFHLPLGLGLF